MDESPRKQASTSRVIDSLHSQIDDLKNELELLKVSHAEYKKKHLILATKNDSLVDQLANCKHENDMVNALLKRKERRVSDLESELEDVAATADSLKHSVKNYKIRCENLQESSATTTAETERLKISYDALLVSQAEYKRHYQDEIVKLAAQLDSYKLESAQNMADLANKLDSNDKDSDTLFESLKQRSKAMDTMFVNRNREMLALLSALAKAAKSHGEECKDILLDNVAVINTLRESYPELLEKLAERSETTVDVDEILSESKVALDTSFVEPELIEEEILTQRLASILRRRGNAGKRNSMRLTPEVLDSPLSETMPKQRNAQKPPQRRNQSSDSSHLGNQRYQKRQPTNNGLNVLTRGQNRSTSNGLASNYTNSQNSTRSGQLSSNSSKSHKRRLFYGGSSNFNSASGDRKSLAKSHSAEPTEFN